MTWDPPKRERNVRVHGLDFADARDRFEWATADVSQSYPGRDGRPRFLAVGYLDGHLVALVFSLLGTEAVSAISLRTASNRGRSSMSKARVKVPMLSDEEEARVQAGIAADPDAAELTDEQLASMRPASEVLSPGLFAALARPRGRPKADVTKIPVKLRLDRATVDAFKATGAGWQTRMNDALAKAAARLDAPKAKRRA